MNQILKPFNRNKVKMHRHRYGSNINNNSFILDLGLERIIERLDEIILEPKNILELGCYNDKIYQKLLNKYANFNYISSDINLATSCNLASNIVIADEEFMPFAYNKFDLIISNLNLSWVNDLPGSLYQIRNCLKPNGVFIANLFGTHSLQELRKIIIDCELSILGKTSPRISPFIDVKTAGQLLQRAKFLNPIADGEILNLSYPNLHKLIEDLRKSGQSNSLSEKNIYLNKRLFASIVSNYNSEYKINDNEVTASIEFITLTGFAN